MIHLYKTNGDIFWDLVLEIIGDGNDAGQANAEQIPDQEATADESGNNNQNAAIQPDNGDLVIAPSG